MIHCIVSLNGSHAKRYVNNVSRILVLFVRHWKIIITIFCGTLMRRKAVCKVPTPNVSLSLQCRDVTVLILCFPYTDRHVLHLSWVYVALSRVFDHHEAKSIIQWGVSECLGMELTNSPVLYPENWNVSCTGNRVCNL